MQHHYFWFTKVLRVFLMDYQVLLIIATIVVAILLVWFKIALNKEAADHQELKEYLLDMIVPCNIVHEGDIMYFYNAENGEFLTQGRCVDTLAKYFDEQHKVYTAADCKYTMADFLRRPVTK